MAHSNPDFYDAIVSGISSSQDHWANNALTPSYVAYLAEILYLGIDPVTSTNVSAEAGLLHSIVNGIFCTNHIIPSKSSDYSNIATAVNSLFQVLRSTLEPITAGAATHLQTTTNTVYIAGSPPPTVGQVLIATSESTAIWQDAAASTTLVTVEVDFGITTTGNTVIDTRPATPSGPGRWKLMSIDLRVKEALDFGVSIVSIGSTSGGVEIVIDQTIVPATSVGSIVGGFSLLSLGMGMSQVTGFEGVYPASQDLWANVTVTGTPSTGIVTAYLLWQGFP